MMVNRSTADALAGIESTAYALTNIILGAGTVINREQAKAARDAGVRCLVCPGMLEEVVVWAQENQVESS